MSVYTHPRFKVDMTDKASVTTYSASAFTALWGTLTFEHWVAILGLGIGLLGLAVNVYYKRREDARATERHAKYMEGHDSNTPN